MANSGSDPDREGQNYQQFFENINDSNKLFKNYVPVDDNFKTLTQDRKCNLFLLELNRVFTLQYGL